jgi:ATP-binding protein involved in chromosome partitioning
MMSTAAPSRDDVLQALRQVVDPASGRDVASLGLVRGVECDGQAVFVAYALPPQSAGEPMRRQITAQTQQALAGLPGVREVRVEFVAAGETAARPLAGVKHVIAVGAGKGGVGKSTVSVLLAVALSRRGMKVGLLDADVYGPSIPKLTGTEDAEPLPDPSGRIELPECDGIRIMSMGYIVPPDQAVIWRGPMAQKYVKEFLDRGAWGELDYLLVDLPPGTGDIPLTLAQSIPLTGAVVVCTPQDVALLDAIKALRMYQKLGVEPLGLVENMSYYLCPQCGHREHIFDHGGCERTARELGVAFLGAIPLNLSIRVSGDAGRPSDNFAAAGPVAEALNHLSDRLVEEVTRRTATRRPLPQLRISG